MTNRQRCSTLGRLWSFALVALLTSCADEAADSEPSLADLVGEQFHVGAGSAVAFRVEDCADMPDCFASNATSPYVLFGLPPTPGAELPPLDPSLGSVPRLDPSLSPVWHLDEREAVVISGTLPPPAAYFSIGPYAFDRAGEDGGRDTVFASIADATNHRHLAASGIAFGERFIAVMATDQGTANTVAGLLPERDPVITIEVSPAQLRLGVGADADGLALLGRVALFDDAVAGDAWLEGLESDSWEVLRLTPLEDGEPTPFPTRERVERSDGVDEAPLRPALDALTDAVEAAYPEATLERVPITPANLIDALLQPHVCLERRRDCLGDNRDTTYAAGPVSAGGEPQERPMPDDGFFVLFGVDHEVTGNATYANAVLTLAEQRAGVAAIDSRTWQGSAAHYLPDHPDQASLFAWHFARDCSELPNCTEVGTEFPGIPATGNVLFIFRAYLNPGATVATDPGLLLTERVFWVGSPGG